MARLDPALIDELLDRHPELIAMEPQPPLRFLLEAAPHLARFLGGVTDLHGHALVEALNRVAPSEMAMARGLCRHQLMRTVTTTASVLVLIAAMLRAEGDDAPPAAAQEGEEGGEGDEEGDEEGEAQPEEGPLGGMDPSQLFQKAFEEVTAQSEAVDALNQLMPGLGWGVGRGHIEQVLLRDMALMAQLMSQAGQLKEIADELGRFERAARRRDPRRGGRSTVVGVRVGGELSDVLPGELAMLSDGATEDLFYQRYVERRLLTLELEGSLEAPDHDGGRRGPVIACVDTSGSMAGRPELVAKALILAVLRRVLPQGRPVRLMLFGGPGDFVDMDIGRSPSAMRRLLEFLTMSFHSGTDFDGPLERAMEMLEEARYEQADVLVITDGYCEASPRIVRRVETLRQALGFEVASVVVGEHPRGVAAFSDRVWLVPRHGDAGEHLDISAWDAAPRDPPPESA